MRKVLPVVITVVVLVLLLYPLSLLFGLPLARRDMDDSRKWLREAVTVTPAPVIPAEELDLQAAVTAAFGDGASGIPVFGGARATESDAKVDWLGSLTQVEQSIWTLATPLPEQFELYSREAGEWRHLVGGAIAPQLPPDGNRIEFSFPGANGPVLLDGRVLAMDVDWFQGGTSVRLAEPPAFGSNCSG